MKTTIVLLAFVTLQASAFENNGMKAIAEGRADYFCSLSRENPKQKDTYDQTVFAGTAFSQGNSESIMIWPNGKVAAGLPEKMTPEDAKNLEGSLHVSMNLTDAGDVKNDLARNITVGISRFNNPYSLKKGENLLEARTLASGYHRGSVMLIYRAAKLSLTCWHKNALGL